MFNKTAKLILVSTSLAPLLGAVAVNQFAQGKECVSWLPWLGVGLALVLICWLLLFLLDKNATRSTINIKEFERNDSEIVAFLIAYLLPFISQDNLGFNGEWLTGAYILAIIFLVIAHTNTLHFNPVMGLLGYHFYGVKDGEGVSYLLISKKELNRPQDNMKVVAVASNIYLQVKE